jgi:hypothetical protein
MEVNIRTAPVSQRGWKMKIPLSPGLRGISLSIVGFNLGLKIISTAGFSTFYPISGRKKSLIAE